MRNDHDNNEAVDRAAGWTAHQAARLGITENEILEAIRERGWLPEQFGNVKSRYDLQGLPPMLTGVPAYIDAKMENKVWAMAREKIATRKTNARKAA
jgi:hypothetical protein